MQDTANRAVDSVERCGCAAHVENRRLVIDAIDCPERGRLSVSAACRATAIAALDGRSIAEMRTRIDGGEYVHRGWAVGLLVAAGRFAAFVSHDETLAARAHRDPVGAAYEAAGCGGRIAELAAETGLVEGARRVADYEEVFDGIERELNPLTSAKRTRDMLHDIDSAGELAPEELRARYDERLRTVIEERGIETVTNETGVEHGTVTALADGESPELTLEEAAAILAVSENEPDADAIVLETRDHLLMGMTTAVLDVEAVESGIEGAFDAREIQQKIEGRLPMTLDELAMIHGYIESRKP